MSTVEQALGIAKQIARDVRTNVQEKTDNLNPYDMMVVNSRLARSLRSLARDLEAYEPPPPPPPDEVKAVGNVVDVPESKWHRVGVDVNVNQGIIIPIRKETDDEV